MRYLMGGVKISITKTLKSKVFKRWLKFGSTDFYPTLYIGSRELSRSSTVKYIFSDRVNIIVPSL